VTSHPPHQNAEGTGGGAGLVADGPTLEQVVLGYRLPVADPKWTCPHKRCVMWSEIDFLLKNVMIN